MLDYRDRLQSLMDEGIDGKPVDRTQLATLLGVTYQAVRKLFETNGSFGSTNNLKAAELFGVDPTWLAKGVGDRNVAKFVARTKRVAAFTPQATMLATLFDQLPEENVIGRAVAYNSASQAILDQLQKDSVPARQDSGTPSQQSQTAPASTHQL